MVTSRSRATGRQATRWSSTSRCPIRRIVANERVAADRQRVALQRGPIVFAAEWADNPGGKVRNLVLPDASTLRSEFRPALLGGVQVITGKGLGLALDERGAVTRREQEITFTPYATWANRGRGQMAVWMARTPDVAKPAHWPTIATQATVKTSTARKYPGVVNDGEAPASSDDATAYFDWWPKKGTSEWAELTFKAPTTVSQVDVYWFDDTGRGAVRVPASWRLLYKDGDAWKPVEATSRYGVDRDRFNTVTFARVNTPALRIELAMRPEFSAGIQEWTVR